MPTQFKSLYFRTRINEVGIRSKPVPVLEVPRANDKRLDFQLRDLARNKGFIDLNNAEVYFKVKTGKYNQEYMIEKSIGNGITIVSPSEGKITVALDAEELDISASDYWYDVFIIIDGQISSHLLGKFRVLA